MGRSPRATSPPARFKRRGGDGEKHGLALRDVVRVVDGYRTGAFQAYLAKHGSWSVPCEACCFSLLAARRSVDFYVDGAAGAGAAAVEAARAWRDALRTLLDHVRRREDEAGDSIAGPPARNAVAAARERWDPAAHGAALFAAVQQGDLGTLRWCFDHGCPVDFMDAATGDSVLMVACRLGRLDVARMALLTYQGRILRALPRHVVSTSARSSDGPRRLSFPSEARNDVHPAFGQTALQVAVSSGHAGLVRLLLETAARSGADEVIVNYADEHGEAPLHVAARCGGSATKVAALLVRHGADLGLVDGRGWTCLHGAAQSGAAACLSLALAAGAGRYLEVRTRDGRTCLHLAVRANRTECVRVLLEAGADPRAATAGGATAYDLAVKHCSEKVAKLLLEYDVSEGDSSFDSDEERDDMSSLSGGDMFEGLNTYMVSLAKQTGSLMSPGHPLNCYKGPLCAGGVASLPSPILRGVPGGALGSHRPCMHRASSAGEQRVADPHHASHQQSRDGCVTPRANAEARDDRGGRAPRREEEEEFSLGGDVWRSYVTDDERHAGREHVGRPAGGRRPEGRVLRRAADAGVAELHHERERREERRRPKHSGQAPHCRS